MKNLLLILLCLFGLNLFSQGSLVGFSEPACGQTINSIYTYTNYPAGSHGGGYTIYRNGVAIKTDVNYFGAALCSGVFFLNDSTGFVVVTGGGGSGEGVLKTSDYGQTWIPCGAGMPEFIGFYAVNAHYGYLLTRLFNSQPMVSLNLCSDLPGLSKLIFTDNTVNSDKYLRDTLMINSLCNIDSLNILVKNGIDTITYHINNSIPIIRDNVAVSVCPGSPISVPYSIGVTFNPGNVFNAELSDASGSFANPLIIGSLTSTLGGTINATIPSSVSLGSAYRIRVVSNDPPHISINNGLDISIVNGPGLPLLSVTSSNTTGICPGSNATLSGSGASTYTWSTGTIGAITNVFPTINTTYTLSGSNACGISTATISVPVLPPGPVLSVTGTTAICNGSSGSINASGASTYTWNTGANTSSIIINPTSPTVYVVTGSNGGCSTSKTFSITIHNQPQLYVTGTYSICAAGTATAIVSGASTYTWSTGATTPTIAVNPTVNTTYTISGSNACGTGGQSYFVWVYQYPVLGISGTSNICIGSSANLIASGATNYTWSTGATTPSINISPTVTTIYTLTGTSVYTVTGYNSCPSTQTISVAVDNTCADVWPGDANSDGVADNLDVLELGLHFTQAGPPRANVSNIWQSWYAGNWAGTIANGKNLNHSDCDGSGIINDDDTLAIYNNYGLSHAFRTSAVNTLNPQLMIIADQPAVNKGKWGSASIYLGDVSNPVTDMNGLAFTIDYANAFLETDSIYLVYTASFLNSSGQNLNFRKMDFSNGKLYTATTHTNSINASGSGKIAELHYKVNENLTSAQTMIIGISNANKSDTLGNITALSSGSTTFAIVGIKEISNSVSIFLAPNPTNGLLTISSAEEIRTVVVSTLAGQVLLSQACNGKKEDIQLEEFSNGVYFIKVILHDGRNTIKKIVVNH